MSANEYEFITDWRVIGTCEEAFDILLRAEDLPAWWPSVYLSVNVVERGDATRLGSVVDLYTQGWLPYRLRWRFRTTESNRPHRLSLEASGDFVGVGRWSFSPMGEKLHARYDWRIRAEKPLLRSLSPLLKPIFAANHRWAMRQGERSLALEIQRRRAVAEGKEFPQRPRGAVSPLLSGGLIVLGFSALVAVIVVLVRIVTT